VVDPPWGVPAVEVVWVSQNRRHALRPCGGVWQDGEFTAFSATRNQRGLGEGKLRSRGDETPAGSRRHR
jgi:hypothetical protein